MPGFLLHQGATGSCPHMTGQILVTAASPRVFVSGALPVATVGDIQSVFGCLFQVPGPKPQPCKIARLAPAARIFVMGQPAAIVQVPQGVCQSAEQIPQGPPIITSVQTRVLGT